MIGEEKLKVAIEKLSHGWTPYISFWSRDKVCLDGDFNKTQLRLILMFMKNMKVDK